MAGTLVPGDRLIVLDIAGRFQVSQAPVREALERLKQEGLIVGQTNKGSVVSPVTAKEIRDLIILREMVEGFAVRETMATLIDADFNYLEQLIEQMGIAEQENNLMRLLEMDMEFHGFFYYRCNNAAVIDLWDHMKTKLMRFMAVSKQYYANEGTVSWHNELMDALRSGDPDIAEKQFIKHMHAYKMIHIE